MVGPATRSTVATPANIAHDWRPQQPIRDQARPIGWPRSKIDNPLGPTSRRASERHVEPKCFVEFGPQRAIEGAHQRSDALDIDRSNLFRLSFRVARQPG